MSSFASHSQTNSMADLTITDAGADAYERFEGGGQFIAFGSAELIEASVSRCAVTAGRLLKEK